MPDTNDQPPQPSQPSKIRKTAEDKAKDLIASGAGKLAGKAAESVFPDEKKDDKPGAAKKDGDAGGAAKSGPADAGGPQSLGQKLEGAIRDNIPSTAELEGMGIEKGAEEVAKQLGLDGALAKQIGDLSKDVFDKGLSVISSARIASMVGRPAACLGDLTEHGSPLMPGPGSFNVMIGYRPAWRGIPNTGPPQEFTARVVAKQVAIAAAKAATKAALASGDPAAAALEAAEQTLMAMAKKELEEFVAEMGIADQHICPKPTPASPHGMGVVVDGSPRVLINYLPACRMLDSVLEPLGGLDKIMSGNPTVLIGGGGGDAAEKFREADLAAKAKGKALADAAAKRANMTPAERAAADKHDLDMAKLSNAAYDPNNPKLWPPGYTKADDADLRKLGLDPSKMPDDQTVFKTTGPDGEDKYVLAFRGTDNANDWWTDVKQGLGFQDDQYSQGMNNAKIMADSGYDVEFTGHSKGGGQASAASAMTGLPATTFNAAGVNDATLAREGLTPQQIADANRNVTAYYNSSDPLSYGQDHLPIPDAMGDRQRIPSAPGQDGHGINEMIASMQQYQNNGNI